MESIITVLFSSPLPVSLVVLGVICIVLAIVGKIPPMDIKGGRAIGLAAFGILLIVIAILSAWLLVPTTAVPEPTSATSPAPTSAPIQSTITATESENPTSTLTIPGTPTLTAIIEVTQTVISTEFECSEGDYIPDSGGIHPPVDAEICIPSETVGWISSDPARFTIPGIYNEPPRTGFTFALFGPVKFSISGVQKNNVWLDLRSNSSLVGNYDGKSLNLVYKDGRVCEHVVFTDSTCP